jgi:protein SERAC1
MGSTKAEWASILSRMSSVLRQTNRNILSVLEPGSEVLANVQQEFHTMLDDRSRNRGSRIEIHCFYEEVAVLGVGKVSLKSRSLVSQRPNIDSHNQY